MKLAVVAITRQGVVLARQVAELLKEFPEGPFVSLLVPSRFLVNSPEIKGFDLPLKELVKELFSTQQGLIMIMALGIITRLVGPLARDKRIDPAVLGLDEKGKFVISVLSGHLGRANELTRYLAEKLGAQAVITTATDTHGLPAVDLLTLEFNLAIEPFEMVKDINAAIVNGEKVVFYSEIPIWFFEEKSAQGKISYLPDLTSLPNVKFCPFYLYSPGERPKDNWVVLVTNKDLGPPLQKVLYLRPRNLIAGIGCKKGTGFDEIRSAVMAALKAAGLSPLSIRAFATVDIKGKEEGILELAREFNVPLLTFNFQEIADIMEKNPDIISNSAKVFEKIGVGGVCEPVTLLASPGASLILPKFVQKGVTVAVAQEGCT